MKAAGILKNIPQLFSLLGSLYLCWILPALINAPTTSASLLVAAAINAVQTTEQGASRLALLVMSTLIKKQSKSIFKLLLDDCFNIKRNLQQLTLQSNINQANFGWGENSETNIMYCSKVNRASLWYLNIFTSSNNLNSRI